MQKLGKIKKLVIDDQFRVKYGTINYKTPKSIYLTLETWVKPIGEYDFEREVRKIDKQIRQSVYNNNDHSIFLDDTFINVDLRPSGMSDAKRSFMSVEITLFPKKVEPFPNEIYKISVSDLSKHIIDDLIKNNNYTYKTTKD